ncbi:hypothetical protein [Chlorobium sp. KB01]|uniref:hypothetical protein n=1 Tax=Chlorobium sp. KB01 TaxID=1917528 RepID=UPI00097785A7|nr:hypothetical protein [Chlorobium sp. KB01]
MNDVKNQDTERVVVTDIRIPFWSMVLLMVKMVFASIPALIIFSAVISLIMTLLMTLFGTMWGFHSVFQEGPSF